MSNPFRLLSPLFALFVLGATTEVHAQASGFGSEIIGSGLRIWTSISSTKRLRAGDTIVVRHTLFNDGDSTYAATRLDPCAFAVQPQSGVRTLGQVAPCRHAGGFAPGDSIAMEWTGLIVADRGVASIDISGTLNDMRAASRRAIQLRIDSLENGRVPKSFRQLASGRPALYQLITKTAWSLPDGISIHSLLYDAIESSVPAGARAVSAQYVERVQPATLIRITLDTASAGISSIRLDCIARRRDAGGRMREEFGAQNTVEEGRSGMAIVSLALSVSQFAQSCR